MNAYEVMKKIEERCHNLLDALPAILANEAVLFAKENFDAETWRGKSEEEWDKRKDSNNTKKLLVDSGDLSRSVSNPDIEIGKDKATITIGSNLPYAKAHNFGFEGEVNQNVREHERRAKNGKEYFVKAHKRIMKLRIPKRQFISKWEDSPMFQERIKEILRKEINNIHKF
ncbi:phage virion morphogenesis protein [Riemerella anatipestifer]|uniref:phage virion morphogenesis protein n=1 Tax=Riemerella anatipestifer TaxID=34085 RepID=UPI0028590333|nr:phage virion morphogenesis protein [Riemerella anatipestifer]MDR7732196.1 phage virion morphogenesis protein [Riemerella anatipestifer]MDR7786683.1 phage virion morphogenesis protein [Riemerella anatipestifer]MDY3321644.1 phage virion morphogenesis protein [Riemerella anatipestifer]MDY3337158.1 phage virion morphogenesis protein [Riemerella anatipestifer]MDY3400151.1 phage virion morphogenesis protein [Riemerella anatipestifer]